MISKISTRHWCHLSKHQLIMLALVLMLQITDGSKPVVSERKQLGGCGEGEKKGPIKYEGVKKCGLGKRTVRVASKSFCPNPADNQIILAPRGNAYGLSKQYILGGANVAQSTPNRGFAHFEVPPFHELTQMHPYAMKKIKNCKMEVKVRCPWKTGKFTHVESSCPPGQMDRCTIDYDRGATPIVYFFTPRAQYPLAETSFYVDPRQATNSNPDLPFDYAKIDGVSMIFNRGVDATTVLNSGVKNEVKTQSATTTPKLSSDFELMFDSGAATNFEPTMEMCLPDKSLCYSVRTLPKVTGMNYHDGYTTGSQLLKITGTGFGSDKDDVSVIVDGQICDVQNAIGTEIQCITREAPESETGIFYVGSLGIIKKTIKPIQPSDPSDPPIAPTLADLLTHPVLDTQTYMTTENPQKQDDYYGTFYQGVFTPLVSGKYTFVASCSRQCQVFLITSKDITDISPADQSGLDAEKTKIIEITSPTSFRSTTNKSPELTLTKGTNYYLEIRHIDTNSNDHMTVGMIVEPDEPIPEDHPNAMTEEQEILIDQPQIYDTLGWTLHHKPHLKPGCYRMVFRNLVTKMLVVAIDFDTTMTAGEIKNLLYSKVYSPSFKSNLQVSVKHYNADDEIIPLNEDNMELIVRTEVSVTAYKAVKGPIVPVIVPQSTPESILEIDDHYCTAVLDVQGGSDVVIETTPSPIVGGMGPFSGYFTITCNDEMQTATTEPISILASPQTIINALTDACPGLLDIIDVTELSTYYYIQNARHLKFKFLKPYDYAQFQINVDGVYPQPPGFHWKCTTPVPRSDKLYYENIPAEFLHTFHTVPQVQVEIEGKHPAVCIGNGCDFEYIPPGSSCSRYTITGTTMEVECIDLPTGCSDISFENVDCTVTTANPPDGFTCELDEARAEGSNPVIICPKGRWPYIPVVTPPPPSCTWSVLPFAFPVFLNVDVSGSQLMITAECLPENAAPVITIMQDGTPCTDITIVDGAIVNGRQQSTVTCTLEPWVDTSQYVTGQYPLSFCLDTCDTTTLQVTVFNFNTGNPPSTPHAWPNPISPVLRTNLTIAPIDFGIASNAPQINSQLDIDPAIEFKFVKIDDNSVVSLPIFTAFHPDNQTLRLRFLGSYPGEYKLEITYPGAPLSLSTTLASIPNLIVNSYINETTPQRGSIYGGTILTIKGGTFSNNGLENNVKIGATRCLVFSSIREPKQDPTPELEDSEIKCEVEPKLDQSTTTAEEIEVFLKAYEMAVCDPTNVDPNACMFQWLGDSDLPSITSQQLQIEWNPTGYYYEVVFTGDFSLVDGDEANSRVYVDGVQFPLDPNAISATEVRTRIKHLDTLTYDDSNPDEPVEWDLVFGIGRPSGPITSLYAPLAYPRLTEIIVNSENGEGSQCGSVIEATIRGIGEKFDIDAWGLKLVYFDIYNDVQDFCQSLAVIGFEKISCHVVSGTFASEEIYLQYHEPPSTTPIAPEACQGAAGDCQYTTSTLNTPTINSISPDVADPLRTIAISGSNLIIDGYEGHCQLGQFIFGEWQQVDESNAKCYFSLGIPHTSPVNPNDPLYTNSDVFSAFYTYVNDDPTLEPIDATIHPCGPELTLSNPFVAPTAAQISQVYCTFAGGCVLQITSTGLASDLIHYTQAYVTVCGYNCTLVDEEAPINPSTHLVASCYVPTNTPDSDDDNPNCLDSLPIWEPVNVFTDQGIDLELQGSGNDQEPTPPDPIGDIPNIETGGTNTNDGTTNTGDQTTTDPTPPPPPPDTGTPTVENNDDECLDYGSREHNRGSMEMFGSKMRQTNEVFCSSDDTGRKKGKKKKFRRKRSCARDKPRDDDEDDWEKLDDDVDDRKYGKKSRNHWHNSRLLYCGKKGSDNKKFHDFRQKVEDNRQNKKTRTYHTNGNGYRDWEVGCTMGVGYKKGRKGKVYAIKYFIDPQDFRLGIEFDFDLQGCISYAKQPWRCSREGEWELIQNFMPQHQKHGWQYFQLATPVQYTHYRLVGNSWGACKLGKIKLIGKPRPHCCNCDGDDGGPPDTGGNGGNNDTNNDTTNDTSNETNNTNDTNGTNPPPPPPPGPPDTGNPPPPPDPTDTPCEIEINVLGVAYEYPVGDIGVIYTKNAAPTCLDIQPRFGSVYGGETITIYFTNTDPAMTSLPADWSIHFDDKECVVTGVNMGLAGQQGIVQCVTSERKGLLDDTSQEIFLNNRGYLDCPQFRYVYKWSDISTWGGDGLPLADDSIHVPKGLTLLADLTNPPPMNAIIVEGTFIIASPNSISECPENQDPALPHATFDAHYIFAQEGAKIEIGTVTHPYLCKLEITMHGKRLDPELPMFGNKVLAVRYALLDIHGIGRQPYWTYLEETASVGDTQITLTTLDENCDWNVGDEIIIAPTCHDPAEGEVRIITGRSISNGQVVIEFAEPLLFNHMVSSSFQQRTATPDIVFRGEVGILTRNIVFQGDLPTSRDQENGAIISVFSEGDDSSIVKISALEMRYVGQAFKVGRNPIHLSNQNTALCQSFINGVSIRESYNRAIAIRNVDKVQITNVVAYDIMGHAMYAHGGDEQELVWKDNLIVWVKISWSLLNSDYTPAGFWILNVKNTYTGNRVAGSEGHGFWFELRDSVDAAPVGGIIPQYMHIQTDGFLDNGAHSCGRHGMFLSLKYTPSTNQGDEISDLNPPLVQTFKQFQSWNNEMNGVYMYEIGAVVLQDFVVAGNKLAGIEISRINEKNIDKQAAIQDATVIGKLSDDCPLETDQGSVGIVTPRTELFYVNGARFYNFDFIGGRAFKTCSGCDLDYLQQDSGARTVTTTRLQYDFTGQRILYNYPYNAIFLDEDGSLTGYTDPLINAGSWATPSWPHNKASPACEEQGLMLDGLRCDNTVEVMRLVFYRYKPSHLAKQYLKVLQIDDIWEQLPNLRSPIENSNPLDIGPDYVYYKNNTLSNPYSEIPFLIWDNPRYSWTMAIVTGHKYKFHWGYGIEKEIINIRRSERWGTNDGNVLVHFNHSQFYENVTTKIVDKGPVQQVPADNLGNLFLDKTLYTNNNDAEMGDNYYWNITDDQGKPKFQLFSVLVNGKNQDTMEIQVQPFKCDLYCPIIPPKAGDGALTATGYECDLGTATVRDWTAPGSWPQNGGRVPTEGQEAWIPRGCIYRMDEPNTPLLKNVIVDGFLFWETSETTTYQLNTHVIYNRGGTIRIGGNGGIHGEYTGQGAVIELFGDRNDLYYAQGNEIEAGSKAFVNAGFLEMWGLERVRRTRLASTALANSLLIVVEGINLGWKAGDKIAILSTSNNLRGGESAVIKDPPTENAGDSTTTITLVSGLQHEHFGSLEHFPSELPVEDEYCDIRAEVLLLSSNVRIKGDPNNQWGATLVNTDYLDPAGTSITGRLTINHIEMENCSQEDTFKACIRFENSKFPDSTIQSLTVSNDIKIVKNSAFHGGKGKGFNIQNSFDVELENNNFFDLVQIGGRIKNSGRITLTNNVVAHIDKRVIYQDHAALNPNFNAVDGSRDISFTVQYPQGGIIVCMDYDEECTDIVVKNNIVAGAFSNGIGHDSWECDSATLNFYQNVAHSIEGDGFVIVNHLRNRPNNDNCFEAGYMCAYKNTGYGVISYDYGRELRFRDMIIIDNHYGTGTFLAKEEEDEFKDQKLILISNNKYFGEIPDYTLDCSAPLGGCGGDPNRCDRFGIIVPIFTEQAGWPFNLAGVPNDHIASDALWEGRTLIEDTNFYHYADPSSSCGGVQRIFGLHRRSQDYLPAVEVDGATFQNVNPDALAYFSSPKTSWIGPANCGEFPCSAPKNVIISFVIGYNYEAAGAAFQQDWEMISQSGTQTFQIISANDGIVTAINCQDYKSGLWNGAYCKRQVLHLLFQSDDDDAKTRTFSPIEVTASTETDNAPLDQFNNTVNSFSHKAPNILMGVLRMSRFPITVLNEGGIFQYDMYYTGTNPLNQTFTLRRPFRTSIDTGIAISIQFYEQNSYALYLEGTTKAIEYNNWDDTVKSQKLITGNNGCGENRYQAVKNVMQAYITPGCQFYIAPRDIVLATVKLEWELTEFYSAGGTTLFVDRVGSVLGIHPSRIKVVDVFDGSTVIKANLVAEFPTNQAEQLMKIQQKLDQVLSSNSSIFGVPILDYESELKTVVHDQVNVTHDKNDSLNEPTIYDKDPDEEVEITTVQESLTRLGIIAGSIVGVCLIVIAIIWLVMRNKKSAVPIHVTGKGEQSSPSRHGLNLSQEYDTQYHPGTSISKMSRGDKQVNDNDDVVQDNDDVKLHMDEQRDQEEWRHDWGDIDTGRSNAFQSDAYGSPGSPTQRSMVNKGLEDTEQTHKEQ